MSTDKFQPTWATKPKPNATFAVDAAPYSGADAAPKPTSPPTTKPPQYGGAPILYRPQRSSSPNRPRRRGCCCSCILFTSLFLIVLLLLVALTAAIFYAIYRPHRPTFSLSSLHLTSLNLSSASSFSSSLALSLSARNPNSKISFSYDPISVSVLSSSPSSIQIASGKLPAFVLPAKNTTHLATSVTGKGLKVGSSEISALKSAVKKENGLDLEIRMDTKASAKVGKSRSKKLRVRVSCTGIKANADSKEKFSATVKTSGVKCKAKLRFKIWKWNLSW